jgi:hypothetical protein
LILHTDISIPNELDGYRLRVFAGQSTQVGGNTGPFISEDAPVTGLMQYSRGVVNPFYTAGAYGDIIPAQMPLQMSVGYRGDESVSSCMAICKKIDIDLAQQQKTIILGAARGAVGFGTTHWLPTGELYLENVKDMQYLMGRGATLEFINWRQGENDTAMSATTYRNHLITMVSNLRARFGTSFIFHMGTMSSVWVGSNSARLAIQGVLQDPASIGSRVISTTLTSTSVVSGTEVHWDAVGQRQNAIQFANDYVTYINT